MTDEQRKNEEQFDKMLAQVYPDLWRIHKTLKETRLNPAILPPFINAVFEVAYTTGHGIVQVYISDNKVTNIEPTPRIKLGVEALLEDLEL